MANSITPQAAPLYQQLPPTTKPWEVGPIAGSPPPGTTFPAGSYIGGGGTTINTSTLSIVRTIGVKLNG